MQIESDGIRKPETTLTAFYEGAPFRCRPGVTVAAALTDAGILGLRSAPNGERGVFCGMGVCGECTVVIDKRPGQLACMVAVADGMHIQRQPLAARPDLSESSDEVAEQILAPQLLVIGGGPAGLATAAAAGEAGLRVVLVDERANLGGQYYKQPAATFTIDPARLDHQYVSGRRLIARVRAAGVHVLSGVRVWGAAGPREFYATGARRRWVLRPERLVLATGAYERAVPFPGWTLPGVMTTGAAQSLARSYQVAPGRRILIAGNGPLNVQLAGELTRAGASVVGLVELADLTSPTRLPALLRMMATCPSLVRDGTGYLATLHRAKVPILTRRAVVRAEGVNRVERAVVAQIDELGRPIPGSERSFSVDAVCVGLGFMPGNEIARLIGVRYNVDPPTGGYVLERVGAGRTNLKNVWVVGDGSEVRGAKVAESAGELAAADVAATLDRTPAKGGALAAAHRRLRRHERFQGGLWRLYSGPALFAQFAEPETVVCRCESIPLSTIDEHAGGGIASAGAVKRVTRAGMGCCQGRFCGFVVANRVASYTGTAVGPFDGFAPQAPFRPTSVSLLAAPQPEMEARS